MKVKKKKKAYKVMNLSPGTMAYTGKKQSDVTVVEVIAYNKDGFNKYDSQNVSDAFNYQTNENIAWININGLNHIKNIEQLGLHYGLHPLTLEDIVNTNQRPKIEEFDNYLFIVFKMLYLKQDDLMSYEHVSLVVGRNYVITFQEADGDVFDDLRERIFHGKGRIRYLNSDYLMYALLDAVVDHYITIIEALGDKIEDLEATVFASDSKSNETPNRIQDMKQEILKIRRSIFPFREVVNRLDKIECDLIDMKTHSFLRDLYDHTVQVSESVEMYREMIWSLMDMYMTIISNKMNEVMKVLTIIATIFIPMTFIAGIYGMNFDNIPELHYQYSYFILWGVMIVIFLFMLLYFRRKKWL